MIKIGNKKDAGETDNKKTADGVGTVLSEEETHGGNLNIPWLLSYFIPFLPVIFFSFICALIVNAASLAGPFITEQIIDVHLTKNTGDVTALIFLAAAYFITSLIGAGVGYLQENIVAGIGQRIINKMRTELFDKIQRLSMSFFDHNSSGRLFSRLTGDIDAMNEVISSVMISLLVDGIMVVGIIISMFLLSPEIAAALMPVLPIIIISVLLYKIFIKRTFMLSKAALAKINGFLAENINGFGTVRLFGRENVKIGQFGTLTRRYFKLGLREIMLHTFSNPYMSMINNIAGAVIFYIFARDIIGGTAAVGVIYAEITYLKKFFDPVIALIDQYAQIQSAAVSGSRIYSILSLDSEEDYESGVMLPEQPRGEIEFKNVWFSYNGEYYVIKDLSFKIEAGSSVAFVGATGSGKSTVTALISRFYTINSGRILFDGRSIYEYNLRDLRRHIALIQQEPFLFSGSITDNITLGNEIYDEDAVKNAARVTGADAFIRTLPDSYINAVAERGKTFSAGQRQLISFTRAAVTEPSVFILDEATANIDTETEEYIKKAIEAVSHGVTRVTVAHRLSTIKDCDIIFVLRGGTLIEQGTHKELMALGGIYSGLYNLSYN